MDHKTNNSIIIFVFAIATLLSCSPVSSFIIDFAGVKFDPFFYGNGYGEIANPVFIPVPSFNRYPIGQEQSMFYWSSTPSNLSTRSDESFTCEWESRTLICPTGQGILIDFANYGRTTHPVCVLDPVRDKPNTCSTASHTNVVGTLCNGKSSCVIPATNSFFGDTCPNVFKYLQIKYHCQTIPPIDESFTCEGLSKTLTCSSGRNIIVNFANYGRTTHPVCVLDPVRDKPNTCSTPSHTNFIASLCNGKPNCVVPATNSFFGDTCPNVFKYLQIKYYCA